MRPPSASDRIALLRATIARMEGVSIGAEASREPLSLGSSALDAALGGGFAPGLHEVLPAIAADAAAACGFALALAARRGPRPLLCVIEDRAAQEIGLPYAPGLAAHGFDPDRLVITRAPGPVEALWAIEEGLRVPTLAAVLGILMGPARAYDLTASRRLSLAARAGGVPALLGFVGRGGLASTFASAATARFEVESRPSRAGETGEPGAATWLVRLTRGRAAAPGEWRLEWNHDDRLFLDDQALRRARPADAGDRSPAPAWARRAS